MERDEFRKREVRIKKKFAEGGEYSAVATRNPAVNTWIGCSLSSHGSPIHLSDGNYPGSNFCVVLRLREGNVGRARRNNYNYPAVCEGILSAARS